MATGQRASSNPSAMLASLMSKRVKLHEELRNIEKQVYELETSYLQDSNQCGNVLKGFEWFLSASKSTTKYITGTFIKYLFIILFNFWVLWFELFGYSSELAVSGQNPPCLKRSRKFQPEDRLFSLSSVTSPAADEQLVGREDGRSDFGPGRSKGGGTPANGQGKPKKGRTASRDGRRIRPSSEHDLDDEDDLDLSLR
ncbi:chromatin modification-related protein MEAF6-like isoform X2 [Macadamia integrifolia]|uniref:chromatin modification-related protein MEAF6-like isoform X2 n=1 Tax=Macadamia integrifolia TaxID=60698 RepID=UPI001C501E92|nr:chromatin modification-related protein MEAF6-like isoform X2 [Macadamia integrifolia]